MNLREFCRCPEYDTAILTTFTFDPLFFERVVLNDLLAGGATNVIILGDAGEGHPAILRAKNQLLSLGRSYRFIPVYMDGAFHAKICLRLSDKGALVSCSSANLTQSGWLGRPLNCARSGNREVATAWRIDASSPMVGPLRRVLRHLYTLPIHADGQRLLNRACGRLWLEQESAEEPVSDRVDWVLSGMDAALADLIERRWAGRKFDRLRLSTGSTDSHGAMIRWAHEVFGITEAIVELNVAHCGFCAQELENLPCRLRVAALAAPPRTHAKIFLFEAEHESALVVGSPNCSGAAWLRTVAQRGNVESAVIYDTIATDIVDELLHGAVESVSVDQLILPDHVEAEIDGDPPVHWRLVSVELDRDGGRVLASIEPPPDNVTRAFLEIDDQAIALQSSDLPGLLTASAPNFERLSVPFAKVRLFVESKEHVTNEMWIDDLVQLRRLAQRSSRMGSLTRFGESTSRKEASSLLRDLASFANMLVEETSDLVGVGTRPDSAPEPESDAIVPLTPDDVLVSLDSLRSRHPDARRVGGHKLGMTLSGIFALLFAETTTDDTIADATASEHQPAAEEDERAIDEDSDEDTSDSPEPEPEDKTPAQRRRLLKQLSRFVDRLETPEFADHASPTQLLQAAMFPLGMTKVAMRGGWFDRDGRADAATIVRRCYEVLLRREDKKRRLGPLLRHVHDRYEREGNAEVFEVRVGNGMLCLALLAALPLLESLGEARFERALLLRDLCNCELLTCRVNEPLLARWIERLDCDPAFASSLEEARALRSKLTLLEQSLHDAWTPDGRPPPFRHKVGDWIWNGKVGFARIEALQEPPTSGTVHIRSRAQSVAKVQLHFYLNLRQLCETDTGVRDLTNAVMQD